MNDTQKFTDVMYWCLLVVNEHGYYTTDNALICSTDSTASRVRALAEGTIDKTRVEYEDACKLQQWVQSSEDDSDFQKKLITMIEEGTTVDRSSMLASLIAPYYTHLYNEIRRVRLNNMQFSIGYLSEKLFRLKVNVTYLNFMKPSFVKSKARTYNFKTDSGHRLEWTGTLPKGVKLKQKESYFLNGLVKAHEDRDGVNTTVMTRCKLNKI